MSHLANSFMRKLQTSQVTYGNPGLQKPQRGFCLFLFGFCCSPHFCSRRDMGESRTTHWLRTFIPPADGHASFSLGGPGCPFFRLPLWFLSGITAWVSVVLTWLGRSQGELGCHSPPRCTPAFPVAPRESLYLGHVSTGEVFLLHLPYRF